MLAEYGEYMDRFVETRLKRVRGGKAGKYTSAAASDKPPPTLKLQDVLRHAGSDDRVAWTGWRVRLWTTSATGTR